MKTELAVAMLMIVGGLALSVGPAPLVAADSGNCSSDFLIPDSEPNQARTLDPEEVEIGSEDVVEGADEVLHIELVTSGDELEWQVFFLDSNLQCTEYTQGGCNGPNVIDTQDEETCTLKAPETRTYWVRAENLEKQGTGDALDYKMWVS